MTILALEFSSTQRSVALARDGGLLAEASETGGRGANAFGMIQKVLETAKLEREAVEVLAVGLGPGSYTGIRVAFSVAQGWQLACGVKLLGIGSAECLAAQARKEKIYGRIHVVIDAQRGEYYLAVFESTVGGVEPVTPLKIVTSSSVEALAAVGETLVGPETSRRFAGGKLLYPNASMLAQLASRRNDFSPGESLEPVYLRETTFLKFTHQRKF